MEEIAAFDLRTLLGTTVRAEHCPFVTGRSKSARNGRRTRSSRHAAPVILIAPPSSRTFEDANFMRCAVHGDEILRAAALSVDFV